MNTSLSLGISWPKFCLPKFGDVAHGDLFESQEPQQRDPNWVMPNEKYWYIHIFYKQGP